MRFKWSAFYVILLALLYFHCYLLTVFLSLLSPSLKGLVMNKMKQSHTLTHICCVDEKCVVSFPAIAWDSSKVRFSLWKTVRTHWRKRCNVKCMISPGDWFFFLSWYCSRFYFCFIFFCSLSLYISSSFCAVKVSRHIFSCVIFERWQIREVKNCTFSNSVCVCVCVVRNSCEHRSMNVKSASSHISYVIFWFLSRSIRITLLDVVDALIFVGVLAYILIRRFVYAISLVERWLVLSPLHFAYLLIYFTATKRMSTDKMILLFSTRFSQYFPVVFFLALSVLAAFFSFFTCIMSSSGLSRPFWHVLLILLLCWCSHARNIIIYYTLFYIICMHWTLEAVTEWLDGCRGYNASRRIIVYVMLCI